VKKLLSILAQQKIPLNICYRNYEVRKELLIIKKSPESYASTIEVRELVNLYEVFESEEDVSVVLLKNGDICIQRIPSP